MIKNIYAIKDRLQGFMSPFSDINDENAMRSFDAGCKTNNVVYFNPSDFSLYRLGQYDDESGLITSLPTPLFLMEAIDHRKDKENDKIQNEI